MTAPTEWPPIVELAGLPGSGKTSVSDLAIRRLQEMGYRCASREDIRHRVRELYKRSGIVAKGRLRAKLLGRYPDIAWCCFAYALRVRPMNWKSVRFAWELLKLVDLCGELRRSNEYDIAILDQNLAQCIWSITLSGRPPRDLFLHRLGARLADAVGPLVVHLDVASVIAAERVGKRRTSHSRFDFLSPQQLIATMEARKDYLKRVAAIVAGDEKSLLLLDGGASVSETCEAFVVWCERRLERSI